MASLSKTIARYVLNANRRDKRLRGAARAVQRTDIDVFAFQDALLSLPLPAAHPVPMAILFQQAFYLPFVGCLPKAGSRVASAQQN
jgi:hypothetical protein